MNKQYAKTMTSIHDFDKKKPPNTNTNNNSNNTSVTGNVTNIPINMLTTDDDQRDDVLSILTNYNDLAKNNKFNKALFREDQIMQTLSVLKTKRRPNALLIGGAGVGKTQIVEEIANRLVNNDPIVKTILGDVTIYELQLSQIVSGSSFVGQLEQKVQTIIDFAKDPDNNVILFIDEIHQIMGGSKSSQYNQIAQIIKPELGRGELNIIGATTTQEASVFLTDPAFSRRWYSVQIPELSIEQTEFIVELVRDQFINHHNVYVPDDIIHDIVTISDEYKQYGSHRPDTAISLMDKAMSDAKIKRLNLIEKMQKDPATANIMTSNMPIILNTEQLKQSATALLTGDDNLFDTNAERLSKNLHEQIIGQTEAKTEIIDAVKRLSLHLTKRTKPVSFLFAGPSGTGKTEIAKQLTTSIFGSKSKMIYLNLSEFSNPASLTRITGSPAGYIGSDSKAELPFDSLETSPYQVIVLDEFEKAHRDIQQFFMQALDEGSVKTSNNKSIDFTRSIIIATTNAGVTEMTQSRIGFNQNAELDQNKTTEQIIDLLKTSFNVELLNRFEKIIAFTSISKNDYVKVLAIKYNNLIKEMQINRNDIEFKPEYISKTDAETNPTLLKLADESYAKSSNARPAERTIRKYIENTILENSNQTIFDLL